MFYAIDHHASEVHILAVGGKLKDRLTIDGERSSDEDCLSRGGEGDVECLTLGVLLAISDEDEIERLTLAYSPEFQAILGVANEQIRRGEKGSSADFRRELQGTDPKAITPKRGKSR